MTETPLEGHRRYWADRAAYWRRKGDEALAAICLRNMDTLHTETVAEMERWAKTALAKAA